MKGIEEKFGAAKKNIHGAAAINPANKRILKELQGITDASSLTEDDEKIKEMEKARFSHSKRAYTRRKRNVPVRS